MASSSTAKHAASTENTVFVRFIPPSANIRRHHLEDLFSQIGPIKKSSVIVPRKSTEKQQQQTQQQQRRQRQSDTNDDEATTTAASYGFIKYTSAEDAKMAATKLNHATISLDQSETIRLRVERASDAATANTNKNNKGKNNKKKKSPNQPQPQQQSPSNDANEEEEQATNNKANRVILRNLSFYAKEAHVRKALQEQFGNVVTEIHIPKVPTTTTTNNTNNNNHQSTTTTTHRGFCFVTFETLQQAQACVKATTQSTLVIQNRPVSAAMAINKTMFEANKQQQQQQKQQKQEHSEKDAPSLQEEMEEQNTGDDGSDTEDSDDDDKDGDSESDSNSNDSEADQEMDSEKEDDDDDDDSDDIDKDNQSPDKATTNDRDENAVAEKRALFLRNLPFDATRHDVYDLFRRFGFITGIFLVKDRETNIPKGTAFVSFRSKASVTKALALANSEKFVSQRDAVTKSEAVSAAPTSTDSTTSAQLAVKGRQIFVSLALDKNTAETLVMEKNSDRQTSGKDRRNLYLKGEGRVDNEHENDTKWEDLPEQDKTKRQRAWAEKNSKLRSPIFFINPTRLSLRNLAKHVDEQELKQLCVDATKKGLTKGLVSAEDVIAHWRASGDMTSRDIMDRVESSTDDSIIAPFSDKNVKRHIPSVFIDRDFSGSKKTAAPSRGFGFVEFEHHVHALACLRELNNNMGYSLQFAAGGKHAMELRKKPARRKKGKQDEVGVESALDARGKFKVPRLIVEFTVENKAKARLQAEHRAQQHANSIKQRMEHREKSRVNNNSNKKKQKKESRGARQRERKRKGLQEGQEEKEEGATTASTTTTTERAGKKQKRDDASSRDGPSKEATAKTKPSKPQKKKQKVDAEDAHFERLVASYKGAFAREEEGSGAGSGADIQALAAKQNKKRWFED